jgi:hypothetical protein
MVTTNQFVRSIGFLQVPILKPTTYYKLLASTSPRPVCRTNASNQLDTPLPQRWVQHFGIQTLHRQTFSFGARHT